MLCAKTLSGLALDILKVESWTQMGRAANIIIKYSIHVFASICKNTRILLMGRRYRERCLFLAATKQLYEWYFLSVCPSVCLSVVTPFYPSALRAGGVLSSRLGGRLPNLRNPYLSNRLTDFLNSKFCGIV